MRRAPTPTTRLGELTRHTTIRAARALAFLCYYIRLFLRANLVVAREIVTPGSTLAPAIVELRLRGRTPLEIASIAHLINLMPGTLVLEVRNRPPTLFVHGMHASDPDDFRRALTDLENRYLHVLRQHGSEDK
jgi:multicomponent Na+:H+ antiporter subunit E